MSIFSHYCVLIVLYITWIQVLYQILYWEIWPPSLWLLFSPPNSAFQTVEILSFDKDQFIFLFSFMGYTLGVIFKRSLPKSESHRFAPVFFQKFYFYWILHLGL